MVLFKIFSKVFFIAGFLRCSFQSHVNCNVSLAILGIGDDPNNTCRWNYGSEENIVIGAQLDNHCPAKAKNITYSWDVFTVNSVDWKTSHPNDIRDQDTDISSITISSDYLPFDLYAINLTVEMDLENSTVTLDKMGYFMSACWPYDANSVECTVPQSRLTDFKSTVTVAQSKHCSIVNSSEEIVSVNISYPESRDGVQSFYLIDEELSWRDSKQRCEDRHETLAIIDSQQKLDTVIEFIVNWTSVNANRDLKDMWFGLTYDRVNKVFKWINGREYEWSKWDTGEPNGLESYRRPEHCVRLDESSFTFRTHQCYRNHYAICESKVIVTYNDSGKTNETDVDSAKPKDTDVEFIKPIITEVPLTLRCQTNCNDKVNRGETVKVHAECESCVLPSEYHWKQWACTESSDCRLIKEEKRNDLFYFGTVIQGTEDEKTNVINLTVSSISNNTRGSADFVVFLNNAPTSGNCIISPGIGFALLTPFNITCSSFTDEDLPLEYIIYKESKIKGALSVLYVGKNQHINSLYLNQGDPSTNFTYNLTVAVHDKYGLQTTTFVTVQVRPPTDQDSSVDILSIIQDFNNRSIINDLLDANNSAGAAQLLSTLSDSLNTDTTNDTSRIEQRSQIRTSLISSLEKVPVTNVDEIVQITSVLNSVTSEQSELSTESQNKASDMYSNLASGLQDNVNSTSVSAVEQTAGILLTGVTKLLDISLDIGDQELSKVPAVSDSNTTDVTSVNEHKQEQVKNATNKIIRVVETVADTLMDLITPEDSPSVFVTENMNIAVSKSTSSQIIGKSLINQRQTESGESFGTFVFPNSSNFRMKFSNTSEIGIQVLFTEQNPFTWDKSAKNVTSPVMNLMLKDQNKRNIQMNNLTQPVDIYSSVKGYQPNSTVHNIIVALHFEESGNIFLSNTNKSVLSMRIAAPAYRQTVVQALILNVSIPLKLLYKTNEKPNFQEINENGTLLSSTNNFTLFLPTSPTDDDIYVGITFEDSESTMDTLKNFCIENNLVSSSCIDGACSNIVAVYLSLQIDTYTTACMYWDDVFNQWSTAGCQVSESSTPELLHCLCNHLTAFAGSFFVLPNLIDPIADAALFLTFFENPVVVSIAIIIWCIYFFLLYWAKKVDKDDVEKIGVTAVSDNNLEDKYMYLICIVTGWWKDAGTTAGVSMYMTGTLGQSSKHALSEEGSDWHHFQAGSEDWFVITTPNSLGDLQSFTVWHDNRGTSPAWNLTRIYVEDLQTKDCWTFLFGEWIAVDKGVFTTTLELPVSTKEEMKTLRKRDFMLKSSQDLRNGHLWISIVSKPPHSTFTRAQRLTCTLSLLLTTMLTNIMFHGIPTDDPEDQKTMGHITLSLADIVIGIESAIIMFPINFIIVQLFIRTGTKPPKPEDYELMDIKTMQTGKKISAGNVEEEKGENGEADEITPKFKGSSPKKLPWWFLYIAWCVAIATALVSTYFVMLYGLKFGYQKSVDFILSFFTSFFQSAFITQPVKVLVIAVIITLILKKPVEFESRQTSAVYAPKSSKEDDVQSPEVEERNHFVPFPLTKDIVAKAKEKLRIEGLVQETIINIILYFIFVCVILFMVHGHRNVRDSYLCSKAIDDIFIGAAHSEDHWMQIDVLELERIKTIPLFWQYMDVKIVPTLDEMNADNMTVLSPNSYHHLVGYYRLRQLRVKGSCEIPSVSTRYFIMDMECIPSYSMARDDTSSYNKSWNHLLTVSTLSQADEWTYQSAWKLKTMPYMGRHVTYGGGGYVAEFESQKDSSNQKLELLKSSNWLDDKTRGVFLEFTLFSPNSNLFSVIMILFEFTSLGTIFPFYQIFTTKLYHYSNGFEKFVSACEIIFVLFNITFTYLEVTRLRKYGRRIYFGDFWNCVEVIQICLSYVVIGLFFQRMVSVSRIIEEYKQSNNSKFVNFYTAIYWDFILTVVIATLVLLIILKFFKLLKFNKRMFLLTDTISIARKSLLSFLFFACVMVFAFSHFGLLVFGSVLDGYKSLYGSFITLFNFSLGASDYDGLVGVNRVIGPLFFFMFVFGVIFTFLTFFIAIINFAINESKNDLARLKNELEVVDYIYDRLSSFIGNYGNKEQ